MSEPSSQSLVSTRERILHAALVIFIEVGFERANIEKIAALAGVTKPTVYSHFGSKVGLLEAVAQHQTQQAITQFSPALKSTGNVRRDLTGFAKLFLTSMLMPEAIRLHRFAIVEGITHPELVGPLLAAGPQKLDEVLQSYLKAETTAGRLRCHHPLIAAKHFMGLLLGMDFLTIVVSQIAPNEAEIGRRIGSAIDVFLTAYGVSEHES